MNSLLVRNQEILQCLDTSVIPIFDAGQWSFQPRLNRFSPVYLEQLGKASLMDRLETKYIFRRDQILNILPALENDYRVLEIKGQRICSYRTVYYDTADFHFFQQHQKGSSQHWKIRQRTYLDSQANFLEVKFKDNRKRTRKSRVEAEFNLDHILDNEKAFLSANAPFSQEELDPKLEVCYTRTTLVKNDGQERVTLDSQLCFSNGRHSRDLDGLMVAEIKQAAYNSGSPFMAHIKTGGVRPSSFSKYCIGISLL
ncbi:MAG: polyphosphate polymerase domain-containing protein, partial [Anaerolineales bacterium]|nr:polyphosphate polymerase domain-containing protein [Anaerolineales bacterium]